MKSIVVYYSPSCAFSAGTIAFLVSRGADAELVNLDEHDDERDALEDKLDGRKLETPTLAVDGELHVAPPLSELKDMLQDWGLPDDAAPHTKIREAES